MRAGCQKILLPFRHECTTWQMAGHPMSPSRLMKPCMAMTFIPKAEQLLPAAVSFTCGIEIFTVDLHLSVATLAGDCCPSLVYCHVLTRDGLSLFVIFAMIYLTLSSFNTKSWQQCYPCGYRLLSQHNQSHGRYIAPVAHMMPVLGRLRRLPVDKLCVKLWMFHQTGCAS